MLACMACHVHIPLWCYECHKPDPRSSASSFRASQKVDRLQKDWKQTRLQVVEEQMADILTNLPRDVAKQVLSCLPVRDKYTACLVCKAWHELAMECLRCIVFQHDFQAEIGKTGDCNTEALSTRQANQNSPLSLIWNSPNFPRGVVPCIERPGTSFYSIASPKYVPISLILAFVPRKATMFLALSSRSNLLLTWYLYLDSKISCPSACLTSLTQQDATPDLHLIIFEIRFYSLHPVCLRP